MKARSKGIRGRGLGVFTAAAALAAAVTACSSAAGGPAGGSAGGGGGSSSNTLTISYSEKVGDELPLWIAADTGIFKKNHVNVNLTYLSGNKGIPALLSGQTQIASIGGSAAVSAEAQGASLKYVVTLIPHYTFSFWAQPKDANSSALKGQRVGITSSTGSAYIGTVLTLKQLGLSPSDVQLVSLGSTQNVDNALIAGTIQGAASHPPSTYKFKKQGLKDLVDLPSRHIPAAMSGFAVQSSYLSSNKTAVQNVVLSIIEAIQKEKSDKALAEQEMAKYMGVTNKAEADYTYDFYTKMAPSIPVPAVSQFAATKEALTKKDSSVASVNLNNLIDPSVVQAAAKQAGS